MTEKLKINSSVFEVDLAFTPFKQFVGLSQHQDLKANSGMLFIYPSSKQRIFNTLQMKFPIDFVWIMHDGRISSITENVPPEKQQVESISPAKYILELNAGEVKKNNIKVGDMVENLPDDSDIVLRKSNDFIHLQDYKSTGNLTEVKTDHPYLRRKRSYGLKLPSLSKVNSSLSQIFKEWVEKQPRPGLVPKSGNWKYPYRWIRPSKIEEVKDRSNDNFQKIDRFRSALSRRKSIESMDDEEAIDKNLDTFHLLLENLGASKKELDASDDSLLSYYSWKFEERSLGAAMLRYGIAVSLGKDPIVELKDYGISDSIIKKIGQDKDYVKLTTQILQKITSLYMKNKYGDTVHLYRGIPKGEKVKTVNVLSYTTDPTVAARFAGKDGSIIGEDISTDQIWAADEIFYPRAESEVIVGLKNNSINKQLNGTVYTSEDVSSSVADKWAPLNPDWKNYAKRKTSPNKILDEWLEKQNADLVPKKVPIHLQTGKVVSGIRWVKPEKFEGETQKALSFDDASEANKWRDKIRGSKMGSEERATLRDYIGFGNTMTNTYLRQGYKKNPLLLNKISALDSLIQKTTIPNDVIVYRGTENLDLSIGDIFIDKGFLSTTLTSNMARLFVTNKGALFKIHVKAGTPVTLGQDKELELIFGRESKFIVKDKYSPPPDPYFRGRYTIYELDMVSS
ncbi:DUF192 domain-containing protein [Candidatus Daviesbacteria bacterium]|nr:DUF192 domain-containing protein [Candidatus Daviesbacteria bacterium]